MLRRLLLYGSTYFDAVKLVERINRASPSWIIEGFIDDRPGLDHQDVHGIPIIGDWRCLDKYSSELIDVFPNARSSPWACETVLTKIQSSGFRVASLADPDVDMAYVDIRTGYSLSKGVVLGANVKIGTGATVRYGGIISHDVSIGDFLCMAPGATVGSSTVIGHRCFIGAGVVILPGVHIGDDVVIGGGAVVHKDVADGDKVIGVPSRVAIRRATLSA
jgi:UDP-perosamine 4-acetyltransferase